MNMRTVSYVNKVRVTWEFIAEDICTVVCTDEHLGGRERRLFLGAMGEAFIKQERGIAIYYPAGILELRFDGKPPVDKYGQWRV